MSNQAIFVLKVIVISGILSVLIKYGGEYLPLHPTTATALIIVLMPSLIIGSILGWRYYQL